MKAQPDPDELDGLAPGARAGPHGVRVRIGVGAGIVLLVAALIVAVIVSVLAPHGSTQTVAAVTGRPGSASGGSASAGPDAGAGGSAGAPLFVHVLGAVATPGLFELRDGARVIDAIAAAGGFSADAEKGGVNLARVVTDGEQLHVPRIGEVVTGGTSAGGAPGGGVSGSGGGASGVGGKVNLNNATIAELDALPRVGPVMAQRIVDWRTTNGRFTSVEDLMSVTGIGQKMFDGLKDLVTI